MSKYKEVSRELEASRLLNRASAAEVSQVNGDVRSRHSLVSIDRDLLSKHKYLTSFTSL